MKAAPLTAKQQATSIRLMTCQLCYSTSAALLSVASAIVAIYKGQQLPLGSHGRALHRLSCGCGFVLAAMSATYFGFLTARKNQEINSTPELSKGKQPNFYGENVQQIKNSEIRSFIFDACGVLTLLGTFGYVLKDGFYLPHYPGAWDRFKAGVVLLTGTILGVYILTRPSSEEVFK